MLRALARCNRAASALAHAPRPSFVLCRWLSDEPSAPGPSSQPQERVVSIDRRGILQGVPHEHGSAPQSKQPESEMTRHLKALIRFRGGPITMAEYMSEVLTNPVTGYYTTNQLGHEVFGSRGDFVTSPEISQLFGELVAIWCVATWQQLGSPGEVSLVELGPGHGTLMADLLRGAKSFPAFSGALTVHMVEVSDSLRRRQWDALRCSGEAAPDGTITQGVSDYNGCQVRWHRSLDDVPRGGPCLFIGHEFLDALPVHQFQRMPNGAWPNSKGCAWRERLVDIDDSPASPYHLRVVLAPKDTPASKLVLQRRLAALGGNAARSLQGLEISPQAMATAQSLAARVAADGGAALLVDYGKGGPYVDSLQAIRRHDVVPILDDPGSADLSAWVDFSALRQAVEEGGSGAVCYGPITQQQFLLSLGLGMRLQVLMDAAASESDAATLEVGARRLVEGNDTDGMGEAYKAFVIAPASAPPPVPFGPTGGDSGAQ